jgi:hypothetical protein
VFRFDVPNGMLHIFNETQLEELQKENDAHTNT